MLCIIIQSVSIRVKAGFLLINSLSVHRERNLYNRNILQKSSPLKYIWSFFAVHHEFWANFKTVKMWFLSSVVLSTGIGYEDAFLSIVLVSTGVGIFLNGTKAGIPCICSVFINSWCRDERSYLESFHWKS